MDSKDHVSSLKRKMEEILQCVVCLEVPSGHVYQCQLGHNTCEDCDKKNSSCPICRQPRKTNKRMRNRTAEQTIEAWDFPKGPFINDGRNKGGVGIGQKEDVHT